MPLHRHLYRRKVDASVVEVWAAFHSNSVVKSTIGKVVVVVIIIIIIGIFPLDENFSFRYTTREMRKLERKIITYWFQLLLRLTKRKRRNEKRGKFPTGDICANKLARSDQT